MSFYLVGLSGKKKSGKNTAADIICKLRPNLKPKCLAFADALKEEVSRATGYSVEHIEANKDTFRTILQWWGTEFRRQHCKNDGYWIEQLATKLWKVDDNCHLVIVTDVRFPNEFKMIKNLGGQMWRIHGGLSNTNDNHPSETALDEFPFDIRITNDSSLTELEDALLSALDHQQIPAE